jgi:hypothetical protein
MSGSRPTPIPEVIDQLAAAIRNGENAEAVRFNLDTLVDLCHRLHITAITYRDIAGLDPKHEAEV